MSPLRKTLCVLSCALCASYSVTADDLSASSPSKLSELGLEELMHVKVTSVSKKPEDWFTAPAAVYVITGDDIRRSGVTSIADALRMAPGLEVARRDSARWAISACGFNDFWATKLLVLIDGRSVYSTFNAGVWWDSVDVLLEDVDRIEVIRGPGGTLWGANAVNGVINIITKHAKGSQGWYAEFGLPPPEPVNTATAVPRSVYGKVTWRY